MPFNSSEARRRYMAKYYSDNREAIINRTRQITKKARLRLRQLVTDYKDNHPCGDCGLQYPHYVMQFDHVRGTKLASISNLVRRKPSLEKLLAEMEKCELVCANCHSARTYLRRMDASQQKDDGK